MSVRVIELTNKADYVATRLEMNRAYVVQRIKTLKMEMLSQKTEAIMVTKDVGVVLADAV